MSEPRNYFLTAAAAEKKLQRMAFEIAEQNTEENTDLIFAGIKDNGVVLAHIIADYLKEFFPGKIRVIEVNLNKREPDEIEISEKIDFTNAVIILIDDVTNTGKTLLYALKPFIKFQPKKIQTLTLVERSHKMFPVSSDYVGISLATTLQDHIFVEVEGGRVSGAYME
ncbi:MAG: phosphoribosyltransferase family protein [Chitinophagaceae bacterium]